MEYPEFLKLPEIEDKFNSMLSEQKEYYWTKRFDKYFDPGRREMISIKMAFITTDMHFTSIHKTKNSS